MAGACFVTWIAHRRTREISRRLDLELIELVSARRGWRRYAELAPRTARVLLARRPRVVVVQSPSIVLTALALLLRPLAGYRVVVDAHNEAVEPYLHPSRAIVIATKAMLRLADRVIVTNDELARIVERAGGRPIVLPDPLPQAPATLAPRRPPSDRFRVTVISTYSADEPFDEVLAAARDAGSGFQFFVTGNPAKLSASVRESIPHNVELTGFLAEPDYWALLASSDVVLDLTLMDNCLVCGAYEAIAAGVPVVLSDSPASVHVFADFAEFTANDAKAIVAALQRVRANHASLAASAPAARARFEAAWQARARALSAFLQPGEAGDRQPQAGRR